MTDNKKDIEDRIWAYIASHRALKLGAIALSGVGIVGGAVTTLEKPVSALTSAGSYVLGLTPKPNDVLFERNAFISGMIFREMQMMGPDGLFYTGSTERLERTFVAVGFSDSDLQKSYDLPPEKLHTVLSRVRERYEGHLESKGARNRAFFNLGYYLRALAEASTIDNSSQIRDFNAVALAAHAAAGNGAHYRLPSLPLTDLSGGAEPPREYILSVLESITRMKAFLGVE